MATGDNYACGDERCIMYGIVKSLCCMPEANTTLYVDYISIIKIRQKFQRTL